MSLIRPFTSANDDYENGLFYPSSDDELSVAFSRRYVKRLMREALEDYFILDRDVFVDQRIPILRDIQRESRLPVPDVLVCLQTHDRERTCWNVEAEGRAPTVCVQVFDDRTRSKFFDDARLCYEEIGVQEYLLFDASPSLRTTRVFGFRLVNRRFVKLRAEGDDGVTSRKLGLRLLSEYGCPRFVDVQSGEVVLTRREQALRDVRERRQALSTNFTNSEG
jgi:Uma2 family endonuclease